MDLIRLLAKLFGEYGIYMIFLAAFINFGVWICMLLLLKRSKQLLSPTSDKRFKVNADMEWNNEQVSELQKKRTVLVSLYAFYANLTAIFPLLGILGTVAALVTYSTDTMMENFMIALSTTLLGVFFAIIFKFIDAFISGPLDVFVDDADHIIQNFDVSARDANEA